MLIKKLKTGVGFLVGALFLISFAIEAGEITYPVNCYKEGELKAVRDWENKWAGKKIDASNIDEVKEFMPPAMYDLYKNTEKWGNTWFKIVPYKPYRPSPGMIEMTKKYAGQAKIGNKGELLNWVSGVPFPNPQDGLEIAYNYRNNNFGDSQVTLDDGWIVDGRLKYDPTRVLIESKWMYFTGRTDTPPVPAFEKNPKDIWLGFQVLQIEPEIIRNVRIFEAKYNDRLKPYDSWIWVPQLRRVIRRNASMRQDASGGGDFCAYDNYGWDGPVVENTYKLTGSKEILAVRHPKTKEDALHEPGQCLFLGLPRERCKAYVLEATNKDPHFIYSKMLWYIDPETYTMVYSERFDRLGKLWKVISYWPCEDKGYNKVPIWRFYGGWSIDVQRAHSTISYSFGDFGIPMSPNIYTLSYLQKHGY
jgi:hypothetical protein